MKKRFLLLFLLLIALTAAFYGCNDKKPEDGSPTVEDTSVRYSSMKGDVLALDGNNFVLTLAENGEVLRGTCLGEGKALILSSDDKEIYVSLDVGNLFSFIEMQDREEGNVDPEVPKGCEHKEKIVRGYVAPACTVEGYSGDEICAECGEILQKGAVMPPKGHFFTEQSDEICQSGCCNRNETRYYKCAACEALGTETYEVPGTATGEHSFTAISSVVAKQATCADNQWNYTACCVCGQVGISTVEVPGTATGAHRFTKPSTKKVYQEPDCGHNARYYYECEVCGLVSVDPEDTYEVQGTSTGAHDYSVPSGVVYTEATCVADRVEYARCSVCGQIDTNYTVTIKGTATGIHQFTVLSDEEASKATCTQDQFVYSQCAHCGLVNRTRTLRVAFTATGHTYVDHICTDCGQPESEYLARYDVSADKNTDKVEAYLYSHDYKFDLLIYGNGDMEGYSSPNDRPWKDRAESIQGVYVYGNIGRIGDYAFSNMTDLKTVKFIPTQLAAKPDDFESEYAKYYKMTPSGAYVKNDSSVWDGSRKYGKTTVWKLGNYAFLGCSSLENLTLPISLRECGMGALAQCASLTSVNTSELISLSSVGKNLFREDTALSSVDLSETALTVLPQETFSECINLTAVVFPSALTKIDAYCFFRTAIPQVILPSSLSEVGAYAFSDCTWTTSVRFSGDALRKIGDYAFAGDTLLSTFEIGAGVTNIGKGILDGTEYYLTQSNWTGSLLYLKIGGSREYLLSGLSESVFLKMQVRDTDNPYEMGLYKKEEKGYSHSTDTFARGGKVYYEYLENEEKYVLATVAFGDDPTQKGWFEMDTELIRAIESVKNEDVVYYKPFDAVEGLVSVAETAKTIADGAFAGCDLVTDVNMYNVEYIGKDAFKHCVNLGNIAFTKAKVIGDYAFYDCDKLVSAELSSTVLTVGEYAFAENASLRSFSWKNSTILPETVLEGNNLFEIYCPSGASETYGASVVHRNDYDAVSAVRSDGTFVYGYVGGEGYLLACLTPEVRDLTLPSGFYMGTDHVPSYTVYRDAFRFDSFAAQWESVVIPSAVKAIEKGAFAGCAYLSDVSVTLSLESIGENVFEGTAYFNDDSHWENGLLYLLSSELQDGRDERYYLLYARPGSGFSMKTTAVKSKTKLVADNAFDVCPTIESLTLPDTVTVVGKEALAGCVGLKELVSPFIGKSATEENYLAYFFGGSGYEDNTVVVPESLSTLRVTTATVVAAHALEGCARLTNVSFNSAVQFKESALAGCEKAVVTVSKKVSKVEKRAFYNCKSLSKITFAQALDVIGEEAFYNTAIKTVNLRETNVSVIEKKAFAGDAYLYDLRLGDNVSEIEENAFENCVGLIHLTIGSGLTTIGEDAFGGCMKIVQINNLSSLDVRNFGAKKIYRDTEDGEEDSLIRSRADFRFADYENTDHEREYYLVAYVGNDTEITLPNEYPGGVSHYKILDYAFAGNEHFTAVIVNNAVTEIGNFAFAGCSSLASVTEMGAVTTIGVSAFRECALTSLSLPESVVTVSAQAFYGCTQLQSVVFGSNVRDICAQAFYGCSAITSVTIPASATKVEDEAFAYCSALTSVEVTKLRNDNVVALMGRSVFKDCTALTSITWARNVQLSQDSKIFENAGIAARGITARITSARVPGYLFYTGDSNTVPAVHTVELGPDVTVIGERAFYYLSLDGAFALPNGLRTIETFAFSKSSVTAISVPVSVGTIGESAFEDCNLLTNVTFALTTRSLTTISKRAFFGCGMTSVSLPQAVRFIEEEAFRNCPNLTNIAIGNVEEVAKNAFKDCREPMKVYVIGKSSIDMTVDNAGSGNELFLGASYTYVYFDIPAVGYYELRTGRKGQATLYGANNNRGIRYVSDNPNCALVTDEETGELSGKSPGSTTVTVTITLVQNLQVQLSYTVSVT